MSFVGGKLKLKGVEEKRKKKKKSKSKDKEKQQVLKEELEGAEAKGGSRGESDGGGDEVDTRTEAEKRYDAYMRKRELELLRKNALKTTKEKVNEFNEKLAALSEHHDIPKVDGSW
ncbi:unnamed protein product [Pedinophyceae sp. YPF-701]|nr:unnamed protein product [Pedinophyceae sp. YPF-701]